MVRRMRAADIDRIAEIWLDTNQKAHSFIPPEYWQERFEMVKALFPQAEIYVCEDGGDIMGFIGLDGTYIAGIFVREGAQSRGIGKALLETAKAARSRLVLQVYRKNAGAVHFYKREGFRIQAEQTNEDTGEREYGMEWKK